MELEIPNIIYKFINMVDGLKILNDLTLKLNHPDEFNDPFDFNNSLFKFNITDEYVKSLIDTNLPHLDRNTRRKKMRELRNKPNNSEIIDKAITKIKERYRVSCFSKVKDEILLWSHYAEKHRGLCIGFSFEPATKDFYVHPVGYKIDINPPDFATKEFESLQYLISTKYEKWEYEKEIRIINRTKTDIINIQASSIKEIIFGCKMDESDMINIKSNIQKNGIINSKYSKMIMSNNKFNLEEISL